MASTETDQAVFVIMAGGSGERFWPVSTRERPKQLLRLHGEKSLLELAFDRAEHLAAADRVYIVAGRQWRGAIEAALPRFLKDNFISEPTACNTAACLGLAACALEAMRGARTPIGVLTADHLIEEGPEFTRAVQGALSHAARTDDLVTIGIEPTEADTAFGYLQLGESIGRYRTDHGEQVVRRVERFTEKPDLATAERFLAEGNFFWNSGMFFWRAATLLQAFEDHQPAMAEQWSRLRSAGPPPYDEDLLEDVFSRLPSLPIDKAIMEPAANVAAVAGRFAWNDVGSWNSLARLGEPDGRGNSVTGPAIVLDSHNNIIYNQSSGSGSTPEVVIQGVNDFVIVRTDKVLLIMPKSQAQDVKKIVQRLKESDREDLL